MTKKKNQVSKFQKTLHDTAHTIEIDAQASPILTALGSDLKKRMKDLNLDDTSKDGRIKQAVCIDQAVRSLDVACRADLTVKGSTKDKVAELRREARELSKELLEV